MPLTSDFSHVLIFRASSNFPKLILCSKVDHVRNQKNRAFSSHVCGIMFIKNPNYDTPDYFFFKVLHKSSFPYRPIIIKMYGFLRLSVMNTTNQRGY